MGLFDTVKLKANALAADAERAGKVTAAQARTVVLQNDIRKAERELGHSAFSLIESGALAHPDLEAAMTRLREARQALTDKEAEIEALRDRSPEKVDATMPTAETAETPPEPIEPATISLAPPVAAPAGPVAEEPPAAAAANEVKEPAVKRRAPAAKKPAPKTAATTKPAAKKKSAAKKPPAATTPPA